MNLKWIVLIIVVLIGSNLLTGISINRFSKKERVELKKKYDSLDLIFRTQELVHTQELDYRRKIFLADSLDFLSLKKLHISDSVSLVRQQRALHKFDKLTAHQLLTKLDSAYEADNKP